MAAREVRRYATPLMDQRWSPRSSHPGCLLAHAAFCAAVVSTGTVSACMTPFEARRTKASIETIRTRLDALETVESEEARQLPELTRTLEGAQALLEETPAGIGAEESKLEARIAELHTRIDMLGEAVARGSRERTEASVRLAKRLASLEQKNGELGDTFALSVLEDKEQLWKEAMALLASGQRAQGRQYCQAFIKRFPQEARAPQAYLAVGLSYAAEARYPNAAAAFQRLLAVYPDSPEAPEAMWQLSLAFGQLSFCKDERALLRNLVERFPQSRPAVDATKALNSLKHLSHACVS